MADNTSLPPYARHTPESSASSATPAYKEPRRHQSQARRPTTPEIKAPVALLINSGTSLHSPSPSLLRKISTGRTKTSPPNSLVKANPASSANTRLHSSTTPSSPVLHVPPGGNNSDSSRIVERSLIRKRPWEKKLPQLDLIKTLQQDINVLLLAEHAAAQRGPENTDAIPLSNITLRKLLSQANSEELTLWGGDGSHDSIRTGTRTSVSTQRRRFPLRILYHRYSFTPHLHIDLTLWGDEIDDIIFHSLAERVTEDGGRVTHLTLDACVELTDYAFASVFARAGHFPRLEALSARHCSWVGEAGLTAISGRCDRLVRLTLDGCTNVNDAALLSISLHSFATLRCFDVQNCTSITDRGAVAIVTACGKLRELGLGGCALVTNKTLEAMVVDTEAPGMIGSVTRPAELASHAPPKLERLSLARCVLIDDDGICPVVESIKTLTHLDLSGCLRITDRMAWSCMETETLYGARPNGGLPRLRYLNISGLWRLTAMAMSQITAASFPLQTVNMPGCMGVEDAGARAIAALVHLTDLDLSRCAQITSKGLSYLGQGTCTRKLRTLRLVEMGDRCLDEGFRTLVMRCKTLSFIDLSDNEDRITDGCIGGILTTCRRLTHVRFCNLELPSLFTMECVGRVIGDDAAKQVLMHVNLSGCPRMDDDCIMDYMHEKRNALALNLSGCMDMTRIGIVGTPNWRLHTLGLARMGKGILNDDVLQELTYTHPDLTALDISGNTHVTAVGIASVLENCPKLTTFNVAGCGGLMDSSPRSGETKGEEQQNNDQGRHDVRNLLQSFVRTKPFIALVGMSSLPEKGDEMAGTSITQPSPYFFFSNPNVGDSHVVESKKQYTKHLTFFVGLRPTFTSVARRHREIHWDTEQKEALSAVICQCAYRSYRARLIFTRLQWHKRMRKWFASIHIQTQWRRYRDAAYAFSYRWERTGAARMIQYVWRRNQQRKKQRRAVQMWAQRKIRMTFQHWFNIAAQQIDARMGAAQRQWKKAADDFRRRQMMKQWVRPAYSGWKRWARITIETRNNARNAQARALSYFRNHNLVKCLKIWKEKIPIRKHWRIHNAFVFMQAVHLKSHNTDVQREKYARADALLRHKARIVVMDILHQHVISQRVAYEAAKKHAIMAFRNRWTMSAFRSWVHLRDWRRKHKADIIKGERHWYLRKTKQAILILLEKVRVEKKKRADARKALNYWIKAELTAAFKGWHANVVERKNNRAAMARALAYMQNRIIASAFTMWDYSVQEQIKQRSRDEANARRNEAIVRRAMARLRNRHVQQCFYTWVEDTRYMQRFKVKFLMKWRRREIAFYFYHWTELMEEFWDLQEKGILEQARLNAAATEIQKIARGMLAKMYWEKEKFATEWAARKMQGAYRVRLAQKQLYKLWRHQFLKDYIVSTEEEFPKMQEEDRISHDLERWWKASTYIAWQWEGYKARRFMWGIRADSQLKKKEFEKRRMYEIMEEADRREAAREVIRERKEAVVIMIQRLWRGHEAKFRYQRRWLRQFYEKTMAVIQRTVRARQGRLRFLARCRWLVMRRKIWWERKKLAMALRGLGIRKRQGQEAFMSNLSAFGFHPETFNLNPLIVVKQILTDVIVAKTAVTDQIKLFAAGGIHEKRRARLWGIIAKKRHARYTPVKGHAVKIIGKNTNRRGETGYVVRIDSRGRKGEKVLQIQLDKDGKLIYQRYFDAGDATSETLPNMQIVCVRCARLMKSNRYTCKRCARKFHIEDEGFPIMNVEKVRSNALKLRIEGERMGIIYRDVWAARLVQRMYRARLSKRKVQRLREKIKRNNRIWTHRYKVIFGCLRMRTKKWREWFLEKRLIKAERLPEEFYPPYTCVPKWYKRRVKNRREAKARSLEISQAFAMRGARVRKAGRRTRLELMPMREWTKKQAGRKWLGDKLRKYTRHKLANGLARCTDGGSRRGCGSRLALGIAGTLGGKSWRKTEEDQKTWARFMQLECFQYSPHVTAAGWVMYHGMMDGKGFPHGRGMVTFPAGRGYGVDDFSEIPRWDEKSWFLYSSFNGLFEHGRPVGDCVIVYKGGMRYEGLYNGEPPEYHLMTYKTVPEKEAIHAISRAREKYAPKEKEKTEEEKKAEEATATEFSSDEPEGKKETLMEKQLRLTGGAKQEYGEGEEDSEEEGEEEEGNGSEAGSDWSDDTNSGTESSGLSEHSSDIEVEEEEVNEGMEMTFSGMRPHDDKVRPWTPGPDTMPKVFRPSTAELKVLDNRYRNRPQSIFKEMINLDRFVDEAARLAESKADGQWGNYGYDNRRYDPAHYRRYVSAYSSDPFSAELLRLPDRHILDHVYQSYARLGNEDASDDRIPVPIQDTAKELWDLLPLNIHGKVNVEDVLHAISLDGAIYHRVQVVRGKAEESEATFVKELAASNAEIFDDKENDDDGDAADAAGGSGDERKEEEEERPKTPYVDLLEGETHDKHGVELTFDEKKQRKAERKRTKLASREKRKAEQALKDGRGVVELSKIQQFALAYPSAWMGVLATVRPAAHFQARSRTPSVAGSMSRPGSPFDLSNRPASRQSVVSFRPQLEISLLPEVKEEEENDQDQDQGQKQQGSDEDLDDVDENGSEDGERNANREVEMLAIVERVPTPLPTPRRPDENRVMDQIEFEKIIVELINQMDTISLMYETLQHTAESARVTPRHIAQQWTLDAKVRTKAVEIGRVDLLGEEETWPTLLESTAAEWDTVEGVEACMTHNIGLEVFAKSVWDVHCGVHTVRCMFGTERVAPFVKKIRTMIPGASVEFWVPKGLRPQPMVNITDEDQESAAAIEEEQNLTEEELEAKELLEKEYPVSITVEQWFTALDNEYEVERALDRELVDLSKKKIKTLLKQRQKAHKKLLKRRKKKKLGPLPLDLRQWSLKHPVTGPLSNLEWTERRITQCWPGHLPVTPFSLAFRALSLLEDDDRDKREADALRAKTPGPEGRTFDDQWGKITLPNGEIYESYMVDNNFDPKGPDGKSGINGRYYVSVPSGEMYDGDMVIGMNHGYGKYYYKDGTEYEGQWFDGKKHGRGELRIFTGEVYRGEWRSDKMHGYGVHTFTNGSEYEGIYDTGKWHGKGILIKRDGTRYEGGFKKGKFSGWGRLHTTDGGKYVGEFRNGVRSGQGHYIPPKSYWNRSNMKEEYKGNWLNDVMHGQGVYYVDQPEGWVKVRDGTWVYGTLRDWTHTHYNDIATDRFCEMFAGRGALASFAAAQYSDLDYQRAGFHTDSYKCRGNYSQFVAENLPHLPPGVNPSDRRVRVIVRAILEQWLNGYGLVEREMVAMDTLHRVEKRLRNTEPLVSDALEIWEEAKEEVLDEREAVDEQKEVLEEELDTVKELTEERDTLADRLEKFWEEEDENGIKRQWDQTAAKFQSELVTKDFYNIRTVSKPNPVLKKLLYSASVMCWNTMKDMNEKYGQTDQKTGVTIPWTDDEWRASKNLIMKSDDNAQNLDSSALLNGPYEVKLWDELQRFDMFKLGADEERILQLQELIFDPQIAAGSVFLTNISNAIPPLIHLIKLTVTYAVLTRKLVPVQDAYKIKCLELADVEEGVKFEKEELVEREEILEEALEKRRKYKAIYREKLLKLQELQKLHAKVVALRNGGENFVTEDVPPVTPRAPPDSPKLPEEYPWPVLEHDYLLELVDEYLLVINEKLLKPWLAAMVISMEEAFVQPDTPREGHEEEAEEVGPEERTDEVWNEIEEAFAVATLKKEEAERALAKAEKKGKEKTIKKRKKELKNANKKLEKTTAALNKEAKKITKLWKAEAEYEQTSMFFKLAQDEVKRLSKGKKVKKNKLKKAETEVKRQKKALSKAKNELNRSKKLQKQWEVEEEEKRIAAEKDFGPPNETISRRTMERIIMMEDQESITNVINDLCNAVVKCADPGTSQEFQEAHERYLKQLAEEADEAAKQKEKDERSPHPIPESIGRLVRLSEDFLKVDKVAKEGPLVFGEKGILCEPVKGKGILHHGRFHVQTLETCERPSEHFYYKRRALMLVPEDEVEVEQIMMEEDDGLERLDLETLKSTLAGTALFDGITRDQIRKYGELDKRTTYISVLRSDGLNELTVAELKEKAGPLRMKKREIIKFGPIESKETWRAILRSEDPHAEAESRPATAATGVSSQRPTTVGSDSTDVSMSLYPSLANGDEDANVPEIIVYETIGFRIGHDNATHETLLTESERADIKPVEEYDMLQTAQAEVERLRAILRSAVKTPADDEQVHHKQMLLEKENLEIEKEVHLVMESLVDCMVRVDYNRRVRAYENAIVDDTYWNKHRREPELIEILQQETSVLDLNPWSVRSAAATLKNELRGAVRRERWRDFTAEKTDEQEKFAQAKDEVIKLRRTLKRMAWNTSIYRRLNEETDKATTFQGAPQIKKGVSGYRARIHDKVDKIMKKDVEDLSAVLTVQELKGIGETGLVTALRRVNWNLDKSIYYAFKNKDSLLIEDEARIANVAEVKKLRRLFYDIAKGPEPNPPKLHNLAAARDEVGRLRMVGRRLLWNQGLIDHLKAEVEWDQWEDEETEEILSVAQKKETKPWHSEGGSSSLGVSTTKDPGGGWAGEAIRAADCLERVADPAIEKLQEKVVKRRADYAKAAKKLKKAQKKKKPKPIAKAQKDVDKVKASLLKATKLLEEKTNGITEEIIVAARKLQEDKGGEGDEWEEYVEKAQKHHDWLFTERVKEVRRLRVAMARFKTSMWEFENPTQLETWLEEQIEFEVEQERIAAEKAYWDSIGYYDEKGRWKLHKKKKKKKKKKKGKDKKKKKKKKKKSNK